PRRPRPRTLLPTPPASSRSTSPRKLALARRFAATEVVQAGREDRAAMTHQLVDGVDYAFEAAGQEQDIQQAWSAARRAHHPPHRAGRVERRVRRAALGRGGPQRPGPRLTRRRASAASTMLTGPRAGTWGRPRRQALRLSPIRRPRYPGRSAEACAERSAPTAVHRSSGMAVTPPAAWSTCR